MLSYTIVFFRELSENLQAYTTELFLRNLQISQKRHFKEHLRIATSAMTLKSFD